MFSYHSQARFVSTVAARLAALSLQSATKSINEVTREYSNLLERLVVDAANGNTTAGSITRQMREAIIEQGRAVFLEGMREGGIKDPEAQLDEDDEKVISAWILSQARHLNDFADACVEVRKLTGDARTAARDVMLGRVELWVQSLDTLGRQGTASAKENAPGTWQLGDTEKHCKTCAKLDGQRHRLKGFTSRGYIPQQPGSDTLDCGGWNCDCQIVDDDGKRLL
jgi:hypothetical protein